MVDNESLIYNIKELELEIQKTKEMLEDMDSDGSYRGFRHKILSKIECKEMNLKVLNIIAKNRNLEVK